MGNIAWPLLAIVFLFFHFSPDKRKLQSGDILFISNPGGQGKAIQLATRSKYTHVGIVTAVNLSGSYTIERMMCK
jgi:hypothetical protein